MTKQTAVDPNAQADSLKMMQEPPRQREFFLIGPDLRGGGKGHGIIIANEDRLVTPPYTTLGPPIGGSAGFPAMSEKPQLAYVRSKGHMPRDIELLGAYWLVSQRLMEAFNDIDSGGFEFVSCDFILPDGSKGPDYSLGRVVREIDAINLEKSHVKIIDDGPDHQIYSIAGFFSLYFDRDKIGGSHIFRQPNLGGSPICDLTMKDKLIPYGFSGVRFREVHDMPSDYSIKS